MTNTSMNLTNSTSQYLLELLEGVEIKNRDTVWNQIYRDIKRASDIWSKINREKKLNSELIKNKTQVKSK